MGIYRAFKVTDSKKCYIGHGNIMKNYWKSLIRKPSKLKAESCELFRFDYELMSSRVKQTDPLAVRHLELQSSFDLKNDWDKIDLQSRCSFGRNKKVTNFIASIQNNKQFMFLELNQKPKLKSQMEMKKVHLRLLSPKQWTFFLK